MRLAPSAAASRLAASISSAHTAGAPPRAPRRVHLDQLREELLGPLPLRPRLMSHAAEAVQAPARNQAFELGLGHRPVLRAVGGLHVPGRARGAGCFTGG